MRYCSTRDDAVSLSFEEVLLQGCSPDGGLFLPESFPEVSLEVLKMWAQLPYPDLTFEVIKMYVDPEEVPYDDLYELVQNAYKKITSPNKIEMIHLKSGLTVAELFHGPTMAFKDLAMLCVGQLLNYFLKKRNRHATVLVATSGDTGGSAIESMKGLENIDVIVLYPKGRCNEIQELQMITVLESNIHCFAADGTSDEEDEAMFAVFSDESFSRQHHLTIANSYNWARILVQISHFMYVYLHSGVSIGEPVQLLIPTGGAGNLTAGCIAYRMGLPITLVAAVNENDVLHQCFTKGVLSAGKDVVKTYASAMDIQVPYNFERLLYLFSGRDCQLVSQLMRRFNIEKRAIIPESILQKMAVVITSRPCSNLSILDVITKCWNEHRYLVCPHTATAIAFHFTSQNSSCRPPYHQVAVATASPLKFPEVLLACGIPPLSDDILSDLKKKGTKFESLPKGQDWSALLKRKIESISQARCK